MIIAPDKAPAPQPPSGVCVLVIPFTFARSAASSGEHLRLLFISQSFYRNNTTLYCVPRGTLFPRSLALTPYSRSKLAPRASVARTRAPIVSHEFTPDAPKPCRSCSSILLVAQPRRVLAHNSGHLPPRINFSHPALLKFRHRQFFAPKFSSSNIHSFSNSSP